MFVLVRLFYDSEYNTRFLLHILYISEYNLQTCLLSCTVWCTSIMYFSENYFCSVFHKAIFDDTFAFLHACSFMFDLIFSLFIK